MKKTAFHRWNIIEYFQDHPFNDFTPQEIQQLVLQEVPLRDVRRSMNRMVEDDELTVTSNKKQMATGKFHKTYRIVSKYDHIWRMYSK